MPTQAKPSASPRKRHLPASVVLSDGGRTAFQIRRIADTLSTAGQRAGAFDDEEACRLTQRVLDAVRQHFVDSEPTTGELRALIDRVLATRGVTPAASSTAM